VDLLVTALLVVREKKTSRCATFVSNCCLVIATLCRKTKAGYANSDAVAEATAAEQAALQKEKEELENKEATGQRVRLSVRVCSIDCEHLSCRLRHAPCAILSAVFGCNSSYALSGLFFTRACS
jgi:hypothetical protein